MGPLGVGHIHEVGLLRACPSPCALGDLWVSAVCLALVQPCRVLRNIPTTSAPPVGVGPPLLDGKEQAREGRMTTTWAQP